MSYLEKVVYLTLNQYNTLASDGTVTYNGTTLTGINDDYLYITSDPITVNDITGVLPINKGGTGLTSIAQDSLLIGSANNDFTTIAKTTVINSSSTNSELPTALSVYTYALMKTGGTLSGKLTLLGSLYNDAANTGALNLNNSNIYGVNSIYTADASDNSGEGIHFYRDTTHMDTLWMSNGAIYFVPNRAYGDTTTAGASLKVVRMPASVTSGAALIADGTAGLVSFKGITDNATATAVTTSDTNLITARTLANAGYVKSSGVTKVSTGAGLTGGDITTTGTVKANLVSETKLGSASSAATEVSGRVYPVALDTNGKLAVNVPWTNVNNSYLTGVTVTGTGNAITTASVSGQSITLTKGTTFLTSHQTYTSFTGKPTGNLTPGFGSTFTILQISQSTTGLVSGTDRTVTIPGTIATNTAKGLVKPWYSHTAASTGPTTGTNATAVAVNAISTTSGKYYAVEADNEGRLFVNVPWSNVNSSYLTGISATTTGNGNAVTSVTASGSTITVTKGASYVTTDTKNTAGSTSSASKLFLIGATSLEANPLTYSHSRVFETAGAFSAKTLGINADSDANKATLLWNSTLSAVEFVFA